MGFTYVKEPSIAIYSDQEKKYCGYSDQDSQTCMKHLDSDKLQSTEDMQPANCANHALTWLMWPHFDHSPMTIDLKDCLTFDLYDSWLKSQPMRQWMSQ